jgi:hypothetical protein
MMSSLAADDIEASPVNKTKVKLEWFITIGNYKFLQKALEL